MSSIMNYRSGRPALPILPNPVRSSSSDHNCDGGTSNSTNLRRTEEEEEAFGDRTVVCERAERAQCGAHLNLNERHERYSTTAAQSERERNMAARTIYECCMSAKKLPLPQLDPVVFNKTLRYIYSNTITMSGSTPKEILDILQASSLFGLADLGTLCRTALQIDSDNVVEMFHLAQERSDKRLEELARSHISTHILEVFLSPRFLQLSEDALCSLLNIDEWYLDEVEVFEHVKRWSSSKVVSQSGGVNSEQQMKAAMGRAFYAIRFPLMTEDDFYQQVFDKHPGLFLWKESQELFKYYYTSDENCLQHFVSRLRRHHTLPLSPTAADDNAEETSPKIHIDYSDLKMEVDDEQLSGGDLVNVSLSSVSTIHEDPEQVTQPPPPKKSRIENPRRVGSNHSEECITVQKYVNALEKRNDKETIEVIDETLHFYALPRNRVHLQRLSEFRLRLKLNKSFKCSSDFLDYVDEKTKGLKSLLFFNKAPPSSNDNLKLLLGQKVNISIHVDDCLILKVNHDEGELIMNMLACAEEIINSLNDFPLKKLAINRCELSSLEGLRQNILETVVINEVKELEGCDEFFNACPCLREIAFDSSVSETGGNLISLQRLLNKHEHLEKVSFAKGTLSFLADPRSRGKRSSLKELYLVLGSCSYVLGSFGSYLNLSRVYLTDGKAESGLFYDIMEMQSLKWIFVDEMTLNRTDENVLSDEARVVHNFLSKVFNSDVKLESDWSMFILEKKASQSKVQAGTSKSIIVASQKYDPFDASKWKGEKIADENMYLSKLDYQHFSYNQFYPDYETFARIEFDGKYEG